MMDSPLFLHVGRLRRSLINEALKELWEEAARAAGSLAGARVLELAGGACGAAAAFARRGAVVRTLHLPSSMDSRDGRPEGTSLLVGSPEALPFKSGAFDVVVFSGLLHRLTLAARRSVWPEAARVLRPGGLALAADFRAPRDPGRRLLLKIGLLREHLESPNFPGFLASDMKREAAGAGLSLLSETSIRRGLLGVSAFMKKPR